MIIESTVNIQLRKKESVIPSLPLLTEEDIKGSKKDWVILKYNLPKVMKDWLDTYRKLHRTTYSDYLCNAVIDNHKTKTVFKKIFITKQQLTDDELKFIDRMINQD